MKSFLITQTIQFTIKATDELDVQTQLSNAAHQITLVDAGTSETSDVGEVTATTSTITAL